MYRKVKFGHITDHLFNYSRFRIAGDVHDHLRCDVPAQVPSDDGHGPGGGLHRGKPGGIL